MPAISDEASLYFLGLLLASDVTISRATDRAANYIDTLWAPGRGLAHWLLDMAESNFRRLIVGLLWLLILLCWVIEPMFISTSAWIRHAFEAREAEKRKNQRVVCKIAEIKVNGVLKGERPFVAATIDGYPGRPVEFLLDSGSSLSLIGKELYEDMKKTDPVFEAEPANISLQTHTNEPVPCLGRVELELNFEVPGTDCTQRLPAIPFYVIDSKDTVPIIGSHLFRQYRTGLQYTRNGELKMTLNDQESETESLAEGKTEDRVAAYRDVSLASEPVREKEMTSRDEHGASAVKPHGHATKQEPTPEEVGPPPRNKVNTSSPATLPLIDNRQYTLDDLLVSKETGEPELAGKASGRPRAQ